MIFNASRGRVSCGRFLRRRSECVRNESYHPIRSHLYQGLKSGKLNIPAGVPPPTLRTPALGDDPRRRVWGVWGAKPHQKATFLNFVARSGAFFKSDLPTYRRNTETLNQFYPGGLYPGPPDPPGPPACRSGSPRGPRIRFHRGPGSPTP